MALDRAGCQGASVRAVLVIGWIALALGCGDERAPPASAAASECPPVAPPPAASDVGGDDACSTALALGTPASLRATLEDLGYDAVYTDACIAARAEATHDAGACDTLSVATLRERCRTRVAITAGQPLDCPSARASEGRDPLCVALAARDRRLCVAAGLVDQLVCERVLGREHSCGRLPVSERAACAARADDLSRRVSGEPRLQPQLTRAISVQVASDAPHALASADRGVRIVWRACLETILLGEDGRLGKQRRR